MQKELEAEKPGGEEALNDLFKSIYGKVSQSVAVGVEPCVGKAVVFLCCRSFVLSSAGRKAYVLVWDTRL